MSSNVGWMSAVSIVGQGGMKVRWGGLMLGGALLLGACGGDAVPNGGTDDTAAADTTPDTTVQGDADAAVGTDAVLDVAPDTAPDTGPDADTDAWTDQIDIVQPDIAG